MTNRPVLFFCGDLHNLGDLALLLQNLAVLPAGAEAYVRRWAALPAEIEMQVAAAGGRLVDGRRLSAFTALAFRCDVVIGGGQLVRSNVSRASLLAQLVAALAARAGGGRVTTRGLGVSRITGRTPRLLWRSLLRLAPVVLVRDEASARNAADLIGAHRVRLTADMAFIPGALDVRAAGERVGDPHGQQVLMVPCIDPGEARSFDGPGIPALIEAIRVALPTARLAFACHDPRTTMDASAVQQLVGTHDLAAPPPAHGYHLDRLLAEYRNAALVVTNRLHSIIFALLTGRPLLIVDDGNSKTSALAERFGIPLVTVTGSDDYPAAVAAALHYDLAQRSAALAAVKLAASDNLGG